MIFVRIIPLSSYFDVLDVRLKQRLDEKNSNDLESGQIRLFRRLFLTHVSKYQLQIVYGRVYQLLVRPPCREGDNTFES